MNHQKCVAGMALAACLFSAGAKAQEPSTVTPDNAFADIAKRWYVSPMYSYTRADKGRVVDDADGGALAIGKQVNPYLNFELYGFQSNYGAKSGGGKDGKLTGVGFEVMGSPFAQRSDGLGNWLGGAYALIGVGGRKAKDLPERFGLYDQNRDGYVIDGGLGYLLPIPFIHFASLRLEARYRLDLATAPFKSVDYDEENDEPNFEELVLSAGLLIPIGAKPVPPAPVPAAVVPVANICSDALDNDGDGKIDFPADAGCTSAEDNDETDPPACSDGKDNDGDGAIDFPSDKGCTAADDTDETDPCKAPAAGEKVSLAGCGTGDVIVLRGVNFEFDKSRLTSNAKTILDGVATELLAYPGIIIELGGHTDAKGSDEYNQKLSEQRAAAVVSYFASKGVSEDRMTSAGFGEAQPVADNETEEGRELNRRVELKITAGSGVVTPAPTVEPASSLRSEPSPEVIPAETVPAP